MSRSAVQPHAVYYPETDGAPIAENTRQFEWIVKIKEGFDAAFRDRPDVFVAGDLFWYPVEGDPATVMAPDAMVVFGRPKGHRPSYKQWEEGGIAPQIVFEVLSHNNRPAEMQRKLAFYDRFGVEEYYVYNPEPGMFHLTGYLRRGDALVEIPRMAGHVSPRSGARFEVAGEDLRLIGPDGKPFATYAEVIDRQRAAEERERAARDRERLLADEVQRLRALLREKSVDPE